MLWKIKNNGVYHSRKHSPITLTYNTHKKTTTLIDWLIGTNVCDCDSFVLLINIYHPTHWGSEDLRSGCPVREELRSMPGHNIVQEVKSSDNERKIEGK